MNGGSNDSEATRYGVHATFPAKKNSTDIWKMPKTDPFEKYPDRYEAWFERYPAVYGAELRAVRDLLPEKGCGLEVGVGTGRFATPLGIKLGVEPSVRMAKASKQMDIQVTGGVAENLPIKSDQFDFILMVTTVCFLDNMQQAFQEVWRVLKKQGFLIVGLVDRMSPLGQEYMKHQNKSVFYRDALFYSVDEIVQTMGQQGFRDFLFRQTIFQELARVTLAEPITSGYGKGSFVVIRGRKATS